MGQVKMSDQEQLFQMAEHCQILGVGMRDENLSKSEDIFSHLFCVSYQSYKTLVRG